VLALLALLALPATPTLGRDASLVRVAPKHPALGDTIAVVVDVPEGGATPTVSIDDRAYAVFPLGQGRYRAFVPTSPLDAPGTWSIVVRVGEEEKRLAVAVGRRKFGVQRIWLKRGVKTELDPIERARVGALKDLRTEEKLWSGRFRPPSRGRRSSPYGVRRYRNGVFLTDYYHRGLDFAPGPDAPVVAPAAGRVRLVGRETEGFAVHGNMVGLDHGHGVVSVFLHLAAVAVREGDELTAGDAIGTVGATGAVTAAHLHWGLYVHGVAVDPDPWLRRTIE
jgi:lysostaphin